MQIYLIIAAAIAFSSFTSGYYLKNLQDKAHEAKLLKEKQEALARYEKINKDLFDALLRQQNKTKVVYRTVFKEMPKNVSEIQKTDSRCNLSIGAKRLLNRLIEPVPTTRTKSSSRN